MADFTALKTAIQDAIKQNGNEEITGNLLQQILLSMVTTLGDSAINELSTAFNTAVTNLTNAIGDEATARQSADSSITNNLNAETQTRANEDTQLENAIQAEASARQLEDNSLSNSISAEVNAREIAVTNEAASRAEGDNGLQLQINGINLNLTNVVEELRQFIQSSVQGEVNARQAADNTLAQSINAEAQIRSNAILNEAALRLDGDNKLQLQINGIALDFDNVVKEVRNILQDYSPIIINGNVSNAPDENDLTTTPNNLLKFKDNVYNPLVFSGMGKKFLRKNLRPLLPSYDFDGFVENISTQEELSGIPTQIFWDRERECFVGLLDGVYYLAWTDDDAYVPTSTENIYMYDGNPYRWNGTDFYVDDEELPNIHNILTQDMLNEENTIYVIRYDFTLGEDITLPANCVLEFDGGSLSNASGNSYTLTGNNTIINSPCTDEYIVDVEFLGTFNKNDRKSSVYVINTIKFGITEGYFEKGQDGHYTQSQYDAMYNNAVGFTRAFEYARDNGYAGVLVPKGHYCFTPILMNDPDNPSGYYATAGAAALIWVLCFDNFDINLNGSIFQVLVDSTQKSSYYEYVGSGTYDTKYNLFYIGQCNGLKIHDGVLKGAMYTRSYTNANEAKLESGTGIGAWDGYVYNLSISNIDGSGFEGDVIGVKSRPWGVWSAPFWKGYPGKTQNNHLGYPYTITNYGYGYVISGSGISKENNGDEHYAISELIDMNVEWGGSANAYLAEKVKAREYTITNASGNYRLIRCYNPLIYVLTYITAEQETPSRVLNCSYLGSFTLLPNERYIKLQFIHETGLAAPDGDTYDTRQPKFNICAKMNENVKISQCYIHNNGRGGIFVGANNTVIEKCIFEKGTNNATVAQTGGFPPFLVGNTNYHVICEDDPCDALTIRDNIFRSSSNIGQILFPTILKIEFCNNICYGCNTAININFETNIHDNRFIATSFESTGNTNWISNILEEKADSIRTMMRYVNISNNTYIECKHSVGFSNIENTIIRYSNCDINFIGGGAYQLMPASWQNSEYGVELYFDNCHIETSDTDTYTGPFLGHVKNSVVKNFRFVGIQSADNCDFTGSIPLLHQKWSDIKENHEIIVLNNCKGIYIDNFEAQNGTPATKQTKIYNGCEVTVGTQNSTNHMLSDPLTEGYVILRNCKILSAPNNGKSYYGLTKKVVLKFIDCDFSLIQEYLNLRTYGFLPNNNYSQIDFINPINAPAGMKISPQATEAHPCYALVGTTAERPWNVPVGHNYFDTTLGKEIFVKERPAGTNAPIWVDATGATV